MSEVAFSLAMSSMVMVPPCSKPALSRDLRASSPNIHWHPIGLAEARRGSRPSASPIGTDRDRKTGALRALLAHTDGTGLNYAGAAFIALGGEECAQFLGELERLATSWAALKTSRMHDMMHDIKWCHPKIVVEVKHLAGSKVLRHATVKGFA
jgi:hypothetical protein